MVIDTFLLNTQQYKVLSRVKWSNPGKVVAIEKGAFWSPSTTVANFIYLYVTLWTEDVE